MGVGLKVQKGSTVVLEDIPAIGREEFRDGDIYALEFKGGDIGHGPRVNWVAVVYRPGTEELFRILCWDGERGGYQPDLPGGLLPEGVTVLERPKKFYEHTHEEAKQRVRDIVRSSNSDEEIRQHLTEAGFNGAAAAITTVTIGDHFMAMVMVNGPMGEIISV